MLTYMFYDIFDKSYVKERDSFAPPERYIETRRGPSGLYSEMWLVCETPMEGVEMNHEVVQIDYDANEYYDSTYHNGCLVAQLEEKTNKNVSPIRIIGFILPEEKFDEYAKRFEIYEET